MIQKNKLLALGDSHLESLKFAADLNIIDVDQSTFSIVPGATVIGLRNPNSFTDAISTFKSILADSDVESYVLIQLGEVDCGFVIWWRAKKYNENIDNQFRESILAYKKFLEDIIDMGFKKICVTGASLPTIDSSTYKGDVANKRKEIDINIYDRTSLTLNYNMELRNLAKILGLSYFDITDAILDRSSGFVHDFFKNIDPSDHHLDKLKVVSIWAEKCNTFIKGEL